MYDCFTFFHKLKEPDTNIKGEDSYNKNLHLLFLIYYRFLYVIVFIFL